VHRVVREVVHFYRFERAGADLQVERSEPRAPPFDALQQLRCEVQPAVGAATLPSCSAYTVW